MAKIIHAKKITEEEFKFRIWSTNNDQYITGEMNSHELDAWMLQDAVQKARDAHQREFPEIIDRTKRNGSSSAYGFRDINSEWDQPLNL